jgi:hypothetical protein
LDEIVADPENPSGLTEDAPVPPELEPQGKASEGPEERRDDVEEDVRPEVPDVDEQGNPPLCGIVGGGGAHAGRGHAAEENVRGLFLPGKGGEAAGQDLIVPDPLEADVPPVRRYVDQADRVVVPPADRRVGLAALKLVEIEAGLPSDHLVSPVRQDVREDSVTPGADGPVDGQLLADEDDPDLQDSPSPRSGPEPG